jgi:hypothetical protein
MFRSSCGPPSDEPILEAVEIEALRKIGAGRPADPDITARLWAVDMIAAGPTGLTLTDQGRHRLSVS